MLRGINRQTRRIRGVSDILYRWPPPRLIVGLFLCVYAIWLLSAMALDRWWGWLMVAVGAAIDAVCFYAKNRG